MRIVDFRPKGAKLVEKYDSRFRLINVQTVDSHLSVNCIFIGPGDFIGRHRASTSQLFMIVDGQGWVSGRRGAKRRVEKGDAVLWETGELHEAGSDRGMTAVVVEYNISHIRGRF